MKLDRRTFLKAGAATLALPMLPSISHAADTGAYPQRLLVIHTANGTIPNAWNPIRDGGDWEFNTIHQPLQPFKDRVTVLEGVDNLISDRQYAPGNSHPRGMASLLSGRPLGEGNFSFSGGGIGFGTGISVDQYIARELQLETKYPFPSLHLGALSTNNPYLPHQALSYKGPDQPVFPDDDPFSVFDRLFGGGTADGSAEVSKLRTMRRSILDAVHDDWSSYRRRLSARDRERVERHLESVASIQERLSADPGAQCSAPGEPDSAINPGRRADFPRIMKAQMDMLVKALACQLTTISTLNFSRATSGIAYTWLPNHTYDSQEEYKALKHHNLSHNDDNSWARDRLIEINTWHSEQFAYLMAELDSIPEPTATNPDATLLDHTLIMTISEIGKGKQHWLDQIPITLMGGAGGAFAMGQHLQFDNRSHQSVLAAIAEGFGVPTDEFGDGRTWDGKMTEILA